MKTKKNGKALEQEGLALIEEKRQTTAPSEIENLDQYTMMFKRTARIARRLERQILLREDKTVVGRDVYALSTLYNQMREIIADLRTMVDMSAQVDMIVNGPLHSIEVSLGQLILTNHYQQLEILKKYVEPKRAEEAIRLLSKLTEDTAGAVEAMIDKEAGRVRDVLLAPANEPMPGKKKRK